MQEWYPRSVVTKYLLLSMPCAITGHHRWVLLISRKFLSRYEILSTNSGLRYTGYKSWVCTEKTFKNVKKVQNIALFLEVVKLLLDHPNSQDIDLNEIVDEKNLMTILHVVCHKGQGEIVKLLLGALQAINQLFEEFWCKL